MGASVTQEFLEAHGFRLKAFPDGNFWVRTYCMGYTLQVDESLEGFTEDNQGWIEQYTEEGFMYLVLDQQRAIDE
ncbi:hypothetical protein PMW_18 [Pseudomonas phage phiPMW]|uniref:Uncharacterized protein n=1 Tax=Pseudomonas phage phiPMW TaxID=1815582 RepID=A0A1S5R155_9CAUD|nr:hypothetical protein FDG97_gp018 [Pseudomonas phage phiPMW]ANA49143.1 hypothetical protein PMW_18 [Pseudomonas phage phiPMW]